MPIKWDLYQNIADFADKNTFPHKPTSVLVIVWALHN